MNIETFKHILEYLKEAINFLGIAVILWGFIIALKDLLAYEFGKLRGDPPLSRTYRIRHVLGVYILLGLEFMIAADIIHTFLSQTLEDLYTLGLVVMIRTALSFFLGREIAEAEEKEKEEAQLA